VNKLRVLRGPDESYSDVIIRLDTATERVLTRKPRLVCLFLPW
jgi:hypothetical protein